MRIESAILPVYAMELPDPSAELAPADAPDGIAADSSGSHPQQESNPHGQRSRLAQLLAEHGHIAEVPPDEPVHVPSEAKSRFVNYTFDSVNSLALKRLAYRLKEERKLKGRLFYETEVTGEKVGFFIDLVA